MSIEEKNTIFDLLIRRVKEVLKIALFFVLLFFSGIVVYAQDIQFSQFYQALLYQNPAFAGSGHKNRVMAHQRLQWLGVGNSTYGSSKYLTSLVSYDTYFKKYASGIGAQVFYDRQGDGQISAVDISAMYSYELHINSHYSFRSGFQLGWDSRTIDYSILTFPRQYSDSGFDNGVANPFSDVQSRKSYLDVSAGGVLYTNEYWIGVTAHHMNTPNQSFISEQSELPMKLALTGGYKFVLHEDASGLANDPTITEVTLTPTFHYKYQGKSDQFDLGLYGHYKHYVIGGWYRGIPFKKFNTKLQNNESFVILGGYKTYNMSFTYSYDYTVSTLRVIGTGGAHEINITYIFPQKKWNKPTKRMPCPNFYVH